MSLKYVTEKNHIYNAMYARTNVCRILTHILYAKIVGKVAVYVYTMYTVGKHRV